MDHNWLAHEVIEYQLKCSIGTINDKNNIRRKEVLPAGFPEEPD
jgi:hypothetical protein